MDPLSRFNLYAADHPEPGYTLVHNTFTGGYAEISSGDLDRLRAGRMTEEDRELADPDVGIVVADHDGEEREYRRWLSHRRARKHLEVTIGVNLACNFACPYCCQAEVLDGSVMKPAVAAACADWLLARAEAIGAERISIHFVGGEPLLHLAPMEQIASRVRDAAGLVPEIGVITNGMLLSGERLDRLIEVGLVRAQVTLDGVAWSHQQTRVAKNGAPTFETVFENAVAASRRVAVTIKGNYRPDTVAGFAPLPRALAEAGLAAGSRLHFTPALEGLSGRDHDGASSPGAGAIGVQVELHDAILAAGLEPKPLEVLGPCQLGDHDSFGIDPTGAIYKCPGFFGHSEWQIGQVIDGLGPRYQEILARVEVAQAECAGCAHRPNCGGGCLASRWLSGAPDGVMCDREYLTSVTRAAVIRGYLRAVSASPHQLLEALPRGSR